MTIKELHQLAMECADLAIAAQREDREQEARDLFQTAYDFERQAASLLSARMDAEPTRSILYRSAASLALDCGEEGEAEVLICEALKGNPPEEIAEELRILREQVHIRRGCDEPVVEEWRDYIPLDEIETLCCRDM